METSSKRLFKSRLDSKQDIWRAIPALMGDGNGNIEVPNQPNYVYIRIGDGDLGQAFNNRCQLRDNLAIFVGYDPVTDPDRRIFQVLTVRMADYAGAGNITVPNVGQHHTTHEFGGGDDVYVDWRRLMGLRVGRPALFVVTVDPGYIFRAGAWMIIPSTTADLTVTHAALVGSEAQYVLISLSGAGVVTATAGAVKGGLTLLAITDVPVPPAGHIPLAAIRLYTAQASIGDTPSAPDIIDLRFPTTFTAGGSNVFGAGVANQFAYWSAADTLASSAEVIRQINTCLLATKSVAALAAATYYIGLCAENTVNAAGAQAGHLLPIVSHLTAAGAAAYSGSMIGFEGWFDLSGAGTAALVRGLNYALQITANGTITNAAIVYGILNAGGAGGTITTGYGVLIGAPVGTINTYYGIFIGSCAAATAKWAFYAEGDKITTKLAAAAGIELDPNAATGNFTLSLSPTNLTANRRATFPDSTGTVALREIDNTFSASQTIGVGAAGVDYALSFNGETNDTTVTWMEDEDYLQFADDIMLPDSEAVKLGTGVDMSVDYDGSQGNIKTDLVAASDLHVDCGTDKTIVLDEVVWDDLRVTPGSFDRPGVSDPTIVAYDVNGGGVSTYLWQFAKDNLASFTVQLPHSYKEGTDISVHIHWTPGPRGNEENGATVGWKVDYSWANINSNFPTMSTADLSDACDGTDHKHQMTPVVVIDGHTVSRSISSMLICNVKRTDTGADDTWAGTISGELPMLLEIDFHFQIDTIGSRQESAK